MRMHAVTVVAVAAGCGLTASAIAQDRAEGSRQLEEIVVTAQKRVENVQDVPVAVTAIDAASLDRLFVQDLTDLRAVAPNVQLEETHGFGNVTQFNIRGIGLGDGEATFDPAVGVVQDGVFINRAAGSLLDLFDIERVEILRGPQGTLFGKNTTGGIVNVTSKRPSGDLGAELQVRGGNYSRRDVRAAVEFPIVDGALAARISGMVATRDGYGTNTVTGDDRDHEDIRGLRGVLTWTPSDAFDALVTLDYQQDRSGAAAGQNISTSDGLGFNICNFPPNACDDTRPRSEDYSISPDEYDIDILFATATLNWHLGAGTLTSVTGWRDIEDFVPVELDADGTAYVDVLRDQYSEQFTQELRFASDHGERFRYVLGLYYFSQRHLVDQDVWLSDNGFLVFAGGLASLRTAPSTSWGYQKIESAAIFGQMEFDLTDRLALIAGGRYTDEDKDFEGDLAFEFQPFGGPNAPLNRELAEEAAAHAAGTLPSADYQATRGFTNFSPKVGLNFRQSDDVMWYLSWTRGFRSGGFNGRAATLRGATSYDDETVDSFELGVKSDLFDRTLRVNAALFHMDYTDMQREINQPSAGGGAPENLIANAGESTIAGAELEVSWLPLDGLRLDASVGYLDAEFDEFCAQIPRGRRNDRVGPGVAGCDAANLLATDNTDLEIRFIPEYTLYVGANYGWDVATNGRLELGAGYRYEDEVSMSLTNDDMSIRSSFGLLDAHVTWTSNSGMYRVSAFGKNLTDETYLATYSAVGDLVALGYYGAPRTYGVELNVSFGQ